MEHASSSTLIHTAFPAAERALPMRVHDTRGTDHGMRKKQAFFLLYCLAVDDPFSAQEDVANRSENGLRPHGPTSHGIAFDGC